MKDRRAFYVIIESSDSAFCAYLIEKLGAK